MSQRGSGRTRSGPGKSATGWAALVLAVGVIAGCSSGSETTSQLTSSDAGTATTTDGADTDAGDLEGEPVEADSPDPEAAEDAAADPAASEPGIEIDDEWVAFLEPRFVSRAPLGSLVALYAEPDSSADVVGSVVAGEVGLTLYDVVETIDGRDWSPVVTSHGVAGWIKTSLLRPEPSVSPPERIGDSPLRGSDIVIRAVAGLTTPSVLADLIDDRGLVVSATAFIDDDAVTLSADQLRVPAADDTEPIVWGYDVGTGDPITATLSERFSSLAGSTAITSTEANGFNVLVGVGSIPSNVGEVFPDAEWVEYHFSGTEAVGALDWESVTFVFDTSAETPVLLAITSGAWAP